MRSARRLRVPNKKTAKPNNALGQAPLTQHPENQREQRKPDQPGDEDRPVAALGQDDLRPARFVGIIVDGFIVSVLWCGHGVLLAEPTGEGRGLVPVIRERSLPNPRKERGTSLDEKGFRSNTEV